MDSLQKVIAENPSLWTEEYEKEVIEILSNWETGKKRPRSHYHIHEKFQLKSLFGVTKVVLKSNSLLMATKESVVTAIKDTHASIGHLGEKKTYKKLCENYGNIPRKVVVEYIRQCERCAEKMRRREVSAGVVVRPISVKNFNERGQADLVDYQTLADGPYRYILHYQDYLSKYHILRPLTSKRATEVARHLFQIFIDFGAPLILQTDNGREFTAEVIEVFCE